MITLLRQHTEKCVLTGAGALLAAGAAWCWIAHPALEALRRQPVAVHLTGRTHEPAHYPPPERQVALWDRPAAQSHGAGWVYEVFTPPVIYYNTVAKSFAVTPPLLQTGGPADVPFDLELVDVTRELFRLQLVGYFGATDDYVAAFVSPQRADTLLARTGRRFEELGLSLQHFEVKKVPVAHRDGWPVFDIAAIAVLHDERTGAEVTLDNRSRKFTATPLALLRRPGAGAKSRALHVGETWQEAQATYRIERIQLDPPEVVVARIMPGLPTPELRVLRPVAAATQLAQQRSAAPAAGGGVAGTDHSN